MLDINTPKGQESLRHEQRAIKLFEERWPTFILLQTPKAKDARCDGLVYRRDASGPGELVAVVETKCRDMTLAHFEQQFQCLWLITQSKLDSGRQLALSLRVPFVGLLYLIPDDLLLAQRIFHDDGGHATKIDSRRTVTQETCNGGQIERLNAFVLVADKGIPARPVAPALESHREWIAAYTAQQALEL